MGVTDWILHVDLDQFIAAVEVGRRPGLRGRPVVVGGSGDPSQRRMVVATASYEARAFGVRSGMPLRTAARRCPDAVFLPSDPPAYEQASARVMATLRTFPAAVEVYGWDEAFLGARTDDPEALAADIQRAVSAATGLSCSVGVGDNKQRAKLATGFAKPAGIYRLTAANWMTVMAARGTDALWGIGPKTAGKLSALGIVTVADLAAADPAELAGRFGPTIGPWLSQLALGAGDTEVVTAPWVPRSRSRETTFPRDLTERSVIDAQVVALAREIAEEVVAEGRRVARVAVKVRFAPFFTRTRIMTLPAPTSDASDIERAALTVLDRFEHTRPVRLLGVRVEFDRAHADHGRLRATATQGDHDQGSAVSPMSSKQGMRAMSDDPPARALHVSESSARALPAAGGIVLADSSDTGGRFTLIRTAVPPGDATPLHRHSAMDESFYVLRGSYTVTCGDDVFEASAGDFAHLPRGLPHKYVAGADGGEKLILGSPGGLESFFDDWKSGMDFDELGRKHQIEFLE